MSDATFAFHYDAEGQRIQQTETATCDTINHECEYRSRLTLLAAQRLVFSPNLKVGGDLGERILRRKWPFDEIAGAEWVAMFL